MPAPTADPMQGLSISQLEKRTGVNRSTVYFYIRQGLLPPAQKASATRALYGNAHVELLEEIRRLKESGLDLGQIRERLSERIRAAQDNAVDLVAQQSEDLRNVILEAAARRFAARGYSRTRISDICAEVGITPQILYAHFPSKKHLFIACYEVYFKWMNAQIAGPTAETADPVTRLAWRGWASYGIQDLSPDLRALVHVEAFHPESDLLPLIRGLYGRLLIESQEELGEERIAHYTCPPLDDELVAYAFIGALENMQMRASWDDRYSREDVMRNLLLMFIAVRAAYTGEIDLKESWEAIAPLVKKLALTAPKPKAISSG